MKARKKRSRYGDGSLWLRGRVYWIQWRTVERAPNGAPRYVKHRESTHSEAKDYAQRVLRRRLTEAGGRRYRDEDPRKLSYEDLRDAYLAQAIAKGSRSLYTGRDGKPTLSAITRLDRFFGGWKAVDVTVADLRRFQAETRKELTEAGTNRSMAILRAAFNLAVRDERLDRGEIPGHFPMFKEPNKARGAVFIEPQWYAPLRRKLPEPLRSAFTLAYHTGIRVFEIRRLRWRDVDVARRVVTLPGEITKTGEPRLVPLPRDFGLKHGKPDDLVFPLGDFRLEWYDACVAIGAGKYVCRSCGATSKGRTCPTHGKVRPRYVGPLLRHTRHTAVRSMSDAGLPEARIMGISGHVTRSMFDRYNISRERDVDAAREAIEEHHRREQAVVKVGPKSDKRK